MAMTRRKVLLAQIQDSSDRLAATLLVERWNSFATLGNEWAEKVNTGKLDARLWKRLRSKAADIFDLRTPKGG